MVQRSAQEADRAAVQLDGGTRRGQFLGLPRQVQQHEPAWRLAEVLHAGDRLLPAVAALLQVHGRTDPAHFVRDRPVIGLEAQPRPAHLDA